MGQLINLRAYARPTHAATVVFVDLQLEHVASPRALVGGLERALANCRAVLRHARHAGLPVAFARLMPGAPPVATQASFTRWIDGFTPTRADMIFDRDKPSCYASAEFREVINQVGCRFVLAGFSGEAGCLATAIDAFHRGHHVTFLADASASHARGDLDAARAHRAVTDLIALYGSVQTTADWLAESARATSMTARR